MIIWVTSQTSWKSLALTLSSKNLCRVDKNYAFSVFCPSTGERTIKCKVKGITLNYENSKVVNFTTLRDMILKATYPVHVHNPKKIKRKHGGVVSEHETKEYKVVFKKRRLMDNFDSLPYGVY